MSKVKLIVCEGYGSQAKPYSMGTEKVIDIGLRVPETYDIKGIVRTDFDEEWDERLKEKTRRVSDAIDPVVRYERINDLVGKLLTLVDAMFPDREQRKAAKDLFKKTAWDWYMGQSDGLTEPWRLDKFENYAAAFDGPSDELREAETKRKDVTLASPQAAQDYFQSLPSPLDPIVLTDPKTGETTTIEK